MISGEEIREFYEVGAVTIDTPLTREQIGRAAAAVDELLPRGEPEQGEQPRHRSGRTCDFFHPALLDLIQHPFFETVAQRVLQAPRIRFFQTALLVTHPQPEVPFSYSQHVDIQYCSDDFQSVPRNIVCSYFLWLSDVNEKRAPLMYRPGSHHLLAAHRQADPALRGAVPCVAGVTLAELPDLPYTDPMPVVAQAGQVTVLTTAMVHGASVNIDDRPRKALVITFRAAEADIGLPPDQARTKVQYDEQLKSRLRPERAHIVP